MNLYHVTSASNVSTILHSGIRTGKSPLWYKKGMGLFPQGFIFAFSDKREAAKWAFTQTQHTSKSTVIITFRSDPINWIEDENPENLLECLGKWIKSNKTVLPQDILEVACQAQWMVQTDSETVIIPLREVTNVWKWFNTHLSAISQFFIMSGDESAKR